MRMRMFAALVFASAVAAGAAAAQPAPYNEAGATMGHWHLISKDVEANKKLFLAMGAKMYMPGGAPLMASLASTSISFSGWRKVKAERWVRS